MYEWMPLPFDNELKEIEQSEQSEMADENAVIYMYAKANHYFEQPIENFVGK